jgi:hypothetical protein
VTNIEAKPARGPVTARDRRLLITIFYEGPWSRLESLCLGIRRDNTLRWEIPSRPVGWRKWLEAVANWAELRDNKWIERYARKGKNPPRIWRRA